MFSKLSLYGLSWVNTVTASGSYVKPIVDLKQQSVEVDPKERIRRNILSPEKLVSTLYPGVTTIWESFNRGVGLSPNGPMMGTRSDGKSPFVWQTYNQIKERVEAFAFGLIQLGVKPGQKTFIGLYSKNRPEWVIAEQACNGNAIVTVPLYDTLGPEATEYIVAQAKISVVVCDDEKIAKLLESLAKKNGKFKTLKYVVKMGPVVESEVKSFAAHDVQLVSFYAVEKTGEGKKGCTNPPKPEDLATVCYTSGTTGDPKGAMLRHKQLIADYSAVAMQWANEGLRPDDVHLSYLPLAHMFERIVQLGLWCEGASAGFLRNGDPKLLLEDIQALKPTSFCAVPRVLNRLYDKTMASVNAAGGVKAGLFYMALAAKKAELQQGILRKNSIWDKLVFHKIQGLLGGRVRVITTGAAPISAEILTFFRAVLGAHIYEGYGQTECCAGSNITTYGDWSGGQVGPPIPCNEIKLVSVPELNYFAEKGQGEVCFRGNNVFSGYLNDAERTAEAIDSEGWLHSGDIGIWLPNGTLKIVDRKKCIFKLAQGEYVAPEKIENIYIRAPSIMQVFVYGDSLEMSLVGIAVVDPEEFPGWAKKRGFTGSVPDMMTKPEVIAAVLKEMQQTGTEGGLKGFEQIRGLYLTATPFSIENDLLTPSLKAKRPQLKAFYKKQIDDLYVVVRKQTPE